MSVVDAGDMRMILRVLFSTLAIGVAMAAAQTSDGQIAGRIEDASGSALPGVRITIANGDQSRVAVSNDDGRFAVHALPMGTYRVAAGLPGFISRSGEIRLEQASPRAYLLWPLEVGCLGEVGGGGNPSARSNFNFEVQSEV